MKTPSTIFVLVFFTLLLLPSTSDARSETSIWTAETDREYYYIGGNRVSLGVIRFRTNDWRNEDYITQKVIAAPKMNFLWDELWYFEKLPDSTNELLVLFWKDHDADLHGWVAIRNTPNTWFYRTNYHDWNGLDNGGKVNKYWKRFGSRNTGDATGSLSIDVKNPKNDGGWTGNHILVSFGK